METPRRVTRQIHLQSIQQMSTPFQIPPSPFMKSLGYGTGVSVYRLDRSPKCGQDRSPWAVKRVPQRFRKHEDADLFNTRIQAEAEILRKLSHPNIVGFRGITKSEDGIETLVLECCKTSLGTILEERNENELGPLPAEKTLKMIIDIARGLDYLHTEAKLLHGDLKSFNVLVKGDFEICKLCDFGVSLPMDENGLIDFAKNPTLQYVGTSLWCAPEVIDKVDVIDEKADIFSFGLIIYETIALSPPHMIDCTMMDCSVDESYNTKNCSYIAVTSKDNTFESEEDEEEGGDLKARDNACGTRPPLPQAFDLTDDYNRIVEIFYCCTNEQPEDRPQAKVIWESLAEQNNEKNEQNDTKHDENI